MQHNAFLDRRAVILDRIDAACVGANRSTQDIVLTAVSKVQPDERLHEALAAGQRVFGENRVQEAQQHWAHRRQDFPDLHLRLIGPLQTNKVGDAMALFHAIETLDRPKLARAIADSASKLGRCPELYVQVNIGNEAQKAGIDPTEADAFIASARRDYGLPVDGLMCIPPVDENPEPYFAALAGIAARNGVSGLSMGMSDDFEIAIARGATRIRIGTALFGSRQAQAS